jgi:hypothetical protein
MEENIRMKKILILLAVLALLPLTQVAAQSSGFKVLSFDIGYAPSYNVETGDTDVQSLFGFNVMVGDDLSAGFTIIDGGGATGFSLLSLKYQLIDKVKAQVSLGLFDPAGTGTGPTAVSGLGLEYAPFTRRYGEYLGTELKLRLEYLFLANAIDDGLLYFGLAFGVGI